MIWKYALPQQDIIHINGEIRSPIKLQPAPKLMFVTKWIRAETRGMYYYNNKIVIRLSVHEENDCLNKAITFMENIIKKHGLKVLNRVHLHFVDRISLRDLVRLVTSMRLYRFEFHMSTSQDDICDSNKHTFFFADKVWRGNKRVQALFKFGRAASSSSHSVAQTLDLARWYAAQKKKKPDWTD